MLEQEREHKRNRLRYEKEIKEVERIEREKEEAARMLDRMRAGTQRTNSLTGFQRLHPPHSLEASDLRLSLTPHLSGQSSY